MSILCQFLQINVITRTLSIFLLVNLILLGTQLTLTLEDISKGVLELNYLWGVIPLALISQSGFLLGVCYFFSLLSILASLYSNNEIYAIRNLGINEARLFIWLIAPSLLVAVAIGITVFYLKPISISQIENIYSTQLLRQINELKLGQESFFGNTAFKVQEGKLDIWRVEHSKTYYNRAFIDEENNVTIKESWVQIPLKDGRVISWQDDGSILTNDFSSAIYNIKSGFNLVNKAPAKPTKNLISGDFIDKAELYQRIGIFLSPFTGLFLALLFSRCKPRSVHNANIFGGVVLYFFYFGLIILGLSIIKNSGSSFAFWLIQGLFNFTILFLLVLPKLLWHFRLGKTQTI